jgi:hypothetical protein
VLTWFSSEAKDEKLLGIWDFLIACEPSMVVFLCTAIFVEEWDEFSDDNMMEKITELREMEFSSEKNKVYFKNALDMFKEFTSEQENVDEFNGLLLEG